MRTARHAARGVAWRGSPQRSILERAPVHVAPTRDAFFLERTLRRMKLKILLSWLVGMLLISVAHVGVNVGWTNFTASIRETLGLQRRQLYVGYLPVT